MSYSTILTYEVEVFEGLLTLLTVYVEEDEATLARDGEARQWDEEYVEEAVVEALDRLICAGRSRRTEEQKQQFRDLMERATPFREAALG